MSYEQLPKRYRITDPYCDDGVPKLQTYYVVRKTPAGAWIAPRYAVSRFDASTGKRIQWDTLTRDQLRIEGARFVLDGDGKRYAHETVEWAKHSYKKRKQWQIRWAQQSIARAQKGLDWLRTGTKPISEMVQLQPADHIKELI